VYDREALLEKFYIDGEIRTPFQRRIKVDERRAFNYLIQSTTSDLVLERAVAIDEFLENKKSFISHIIHDELVLDLCDEERDLVPQLKKLFATNTLTPYMVNVNAGSNYYELEALRI
jgi:DNA polymerase I-like protein with 3'-5' exonuclease and polymerase domains